MAEQQEGRWVTLDNGTHLFIKKGQTLDDAIATLGKEQPTHNGETSDSFDDDYDFDNWDDYKTHGDQGFGGINSDYDFVNKTYNMNVEKLASDFMKEKYPNGFPDFAGDLIYSEKYWNEFEDWAKKEKGIDFEKKSSTADLLGENENKKTVGEDLTNYYNEAFYKQHAGDRDEFIQHNIRRFGIPKGSTRKKEEEYYGKEYDKMHKKSGN